MIKAFFGLNNYAPKTRRTVTRRHKVIDEVGKKRIEDEYRRRQAKIEAGAQKRRNALFEELRKKSGGSAFAGTKLCQRRGGIFKFQRDFIDNAPVSATKRYSMINRARALGKRGRVLPEVEEAYFEKLGKKK